MLRLIVLLLVLGNAAFYAWSHGMLAPAGFAPAVQTEPQRQDAQIRPEAMQLLTPAPGAPAAPASSTPASTVTASITAIATPAECLQAGLFNEEQTVVLRSKLESTFPANVWVIESAVEPARWMVHMGKYANEEALAKKRGELRQLGVTFEPANNPRLEPGLSLGTFATQPEAEAALARIARKGVRTAHVIQERVEVRGQRLRLPAVDAVLKPQLETIRPQMADKQLVSC